MRHVHLIDAIDLPDQVKQALRVQRVFADQALQPPFGEIRDRPRVASRQLDLDSAAMPSSVSMRTIAVNCLCPGLMPSWDPIRPLRQR